MMDLCTDPMGSGSWILIMVSVCPTDLCLQPARTIVQGSIFRLWEVGSLCWPPLVMSWLDWEGLQLQLLELLH